MQASGYQKNGIRCRAAPKPHKRQKGKEKQILQAQPIWNNCSTQGLQTSETPDSDFHIYTRQLTGAFSGMAF
jgi:hypothetical protein